MWESIMVETQVCNKCGEDLPLECYHKRRDRKGVMQRRKVCRVCWLQSIGKPGKKVRPS